MLRSMFKEEDCGIERMKKHGIRGGDTEKHQWEDVRDFLIELIQRIVLSFSLLLVRIKKYLENANLKYQELYKVLEDIYEINFIAGEEDAKLRERLRRKFDYSYVELEKSFEPHENELLENTFENTVYNALYTSETKQSQLKKMKFAPKVKILNHHLAHKKKSHGKGSLDENKNRTEGIQEKLRNSQEPPQRAVTFNLIQKDQFNSGYSAQDSEWSE